jgi:hypothetical protein
MMPGPVDEKARRAISMARMAMASRMVEGWRRPGLGRKRRWGAMMSWNWTRVWPMRACRRGRAERREDGFAVALDGVSGARLER